MSFSSHRPISKAFLFLLFAIYFLLFAIPPVSAQSQSTPSAIQNYQPVYNSQYVNTTSPNNATKAIYDFGHAMNCILIGQSPIAPCLEYKGVQDAQGVIRTVPVLSSVNTSNGLLGVSLSMVGSVIATPPIHSSEFIANLGEQIGIKPANAQVSGSGSGVLSSIFKLWEVSRNIAYFGMILIFLFVGLMVMFRQKLNPQTVVTIQMALPGLVVGLVMITFSYFLASLISDIAFLGTNVVGYYFSFADPAISPPTQLPLIPSNSAREDNVLTIFSRYTGIVGFVELRGILEGIWPFLDDPDRGTVTILGGMDPKQAVNILANMITIQFLLPFGSLVGGLGQTAAAVIPPGVSAFFGTPTLVAFSLSWVAMLALIYSMMKLLLRLVNNLLSIIFLTITAPFYFLAASIPGRQAMISDWMFNMLCNVLAFPAVFAVFYFVAYLLKGQTSNGVEPLFKVGSGLTLTASSTFPLLGGIDLNFLNTLIAFGALIALPSVPDIICKAVGKPSSLAAMAAGAVGAGIGQGQKYEGQVSGGMKGFAGNIGRLTEDPGHIRVQDPVTKELYWRHPKTAEEAYRAGARMGQWGKFTGALQHAPVVSRLIPEKWKPKEHAEPDSS